MAERPRGGRSGRGPDRKLAGILAESWVDQGRLSAVVVGLGLNVNWPADLPDELEQVAVALNHLAGRDIDREDLVVAILAGLEPRCAQIAGGGAAGPAGRAQLMDEARSRSATLGRTVRAEVGSEEIEGTAHELTDAGELVVETGSGELRTVVAGDVVHLRTTD